MNKEPNVAIDAVEDVTLEDRVPKRSWKSRREEYFARREGLFLWLLAPPILIVGGVLLVIVLLWLARQVGILTGYIEPSRLF
jgi:hypothetical protein